MSNKFIYVSLLFFLILSSCKEKSTSVDEIILKFQPLKGQKYITEMQISQSMEADINGAFSLIDQNLEFKIQSDILKDSSGFFKIENQYLKLKMSQSQSNEENEDVQSIDTDDPKEGSSSELENYYYQLKSSKYQTMLDSRGQEISSNLDEVNKKIGGQKFSSPFQKMFQYGVFFPDYPLKEKEVWYNEVSIRDSQIVITGNTRYQLETWDDELVYINILSRLKGRYVGFNNGGQMDIEKTGTIIIYRNTGWTKDAKIEQKISWLDATTNENKLLGNIQIQSYPSNR
jgi:hypothetical protein